MENVFKILKLIWEFVINSQWIASIFGGVLAFLLTYFFYPYIKKRAETLAEQRAAKKTAYNEEKGKNAATKEDIEEITRKIEEVKSEISYANQRKHERIVEQERCLLDIAHYSNLIGNMNSVLYSYLTYQSDRTKVDNFLEDLNGYQSNLVYCRNRAFISIDNEELRGAIEEVIKHMSVFSAELYAKAANAGQIIDIRARFENSMELFPFSNEQKIGVMKEIKKKEEELREIQDQPIDSKNDYSKAVSDYLIALKKHFDNVNLF
jgi:hypothetical protein